MLGPFPEAIDQIFYDSALTMDSSELPVELLPELFFSSSTSRFSGMTAAVLQIPYFCPVVPDKETKLRGPRQGTLEVLDEGNWARPYLLVLFLAQLESFPSLRIQRSMV
jgi:hypothetical protein